MVARIARVWAAHTGRAYLPQWHHRLCQSNFWCHYEWSVLPPHTQRIILYSIRSIWRENPSRNLCGTCLNDFQTWVVLFKWFHLVVFYTACVYRLFKSGVSHHWGTCAGFHQSPSDFAFFRGNFECVERRPGTLLVYLCRPEHCDRDFLCLSFSEILNEPVRLLLTPPYVVFIVAVSGDWLITSLRKAAEKLYLSSLPLGHSTITS